MQFASHYFKYQDEIAEFLDLLLCRAKTNTIQEK